MYLAEVQKQKSGFMGAGKVEIKLLAFQRSDQSWNPVPGEEVIPVEEASNFATGALVLADINANRQVQRLQEAGRPLVNILQNFSRLLERFKRQEEEIEQWKQSLTYQSQEMNRRNMEMEARLEQLQQMEAEFKQLEASHQKLKTRQEEAEILRQKIESSRHSLAKAWEELEREKHRLAKLQYSGLNEFQIDQIQQLIEQLSNSVLPKSLQEKIAILLDNITNEQNLLSQHWQQVEQQQTSAGQQQQEFENIAQAWQETFAEWQQIQQQLEQTSSELKAQTVVFNYKQEYTQLLKLQLQKHSQLQQAISQMSESSIQLDVSNQVNATELEKMPLEQLQQLVHDLQEDLTKNSQFVNDQEEELKFQKQTVEELQAKLNDAESSERVQIETELAEEYDRYQMLNETLVGQRQNLRVRRAVLQQHLHILWRQQGVNYFMATDEPSVDLKPVLAQLEVHKEQKVEELQKLEQELAQLQSSIEHLQSLVDTQTQLRNSKQQEWQNLEQNLHSLQASVAEAWGRVNLSQEILQPIQENWNSLQQPLEEIAATLNNSDEHQTIAHLRQALQSLVP
nr:pilus motility taxis protein HmpF [Gloeocapsopsis dulcis]